MHVVIYCKRPLHLNARGGEGRSREMCGCRNCGPKTVVRGIGRGYSVNPGGYCLKCPCDFDDFSILVHCVDPHGSKEPYPIQDSGFCA